MKKIAVFFDMDGTLLDMPTYIFWAYKQYPDKFVELKNFAELNESFTKNAEAYRPFREYFSHLPEYAKRKALPGMVDLVKKLHQAGADIYVVSKALTDGKTVEAIRYNLVSLCGDVFKDIFIIDRGDKADVVKDVVLEYSKTFMVDDAPANAQSVAPFVDVSIWVKNDDFKFHEHLMTAPNIKAAGSAEEIWEIINKN